MKGKKFIEMSEDVEIVMRIIRIETDKPVTHKNEDVEADQKNFKFNLNDKHYIVFPTSRGHSWSDSIGIPTHQKLTG